MSTFQKATENSPDKDRDIMVTVSNSVTDVII